MGFLTCVKVTGNCGESWVNRQEPNAEVSDFRIGLVLLLLLPAGRSCGFVSELPEATSGEDRYQDSCQI